MKTFVLAAVALSPAALSAQVLLWSPVPVPAPARFSLPIELGSPATPAAPMLTAEIASPPPSIDLKLRVIRPSNRTDFKILVGRPDERYDYKMLTQRSDAAARRRSPGTPRR